MKWDDDRQFYVDRNGKRYFTGPPWVPKDAEDADLCRKLGLIRLQLPYTASSSGNL